MAAAKKAQRRGRHAKVDFPEYGSRTDVGLVRDHNEDSLTVAPPVFAVADGMGGHAAGEVASEIAIQTPWSKRIARLFAPRSTGAANKAWEPP